VTHPGSRWFEPVADHLGPAYLRYSFTKGTGQEVAFLVETLGLEPGMRILDVGCGPGRHAHELARRGIEVVGVDLSPRFVDLATEHSPPGATFVCADALTLAYDAEFDAAISLCQGAFGLLGGSTDDGGDDLAVLERMRAAVKPGGLVCCSAFSSYFMVRFLEDTDAFDAATGVNHEHTTIKDEGGVDAPAELWTTCFTPRELRLMMRAAGLDVRGLWSVTPGAYARNEPDLDHPEFLILGERPR
jgi:SAM-dependent methyltransferase